MIGKFHDTVMDEKSMMKVTIDKFFQLQKRVTNSEVMLGGSADRLCTPSTSAGPFRIFSVAGFQNRTNDIVYCPPIIRQQNQNVEDSTAVVYFGGDVQDFPESMETNRDSRGYMKYNLENSAILLREAFPRSHIIVVRPVRMEFKTFSCFDNFVRGNNAGVPDHTPMNHALQHLEKLLQNLSQRLISIPENEILDQAAQAAAAAAAVAAAAAAAALVSSTLSNASSDSSSSSSNASDSSQEMDIDILQVQENVTVDADGAVIFSNSSDLNNTSSNNSGASVAGTDNDTSVTAVAPLTSVSSATTLASTGSSSSTAAATTNTTLQQSDVTTQSQQTNENLHFNDLNNSNDCSLQQQQQQQTSNQQQQNPLWWRENLNLDKSKLIIIGFSKGCVVLNQFIYEFHYLKTLTPDDSTMGRLLSRIKDMYWLDGGHGGQKNTWITSRSLLETLTRMAINIHVHLTPYQVQDDRRPWIRKEEKTFTDLLRRLGAQVTRHLHYDSQTANLMTHFEVLQAFCQHIHNQNQQQQLHSQQLQQQGGQLTQQQTHNNAQNNDQQHPQPQSQTSEEK
ncbi:mitochondrial protein C2orf69 homolog isoform X1 [Lucilia cuprina]|uniref:mitochondrial protein C2orf69 homolog isoform X1 n=2 Tax=Lucilia cuprina TaxID=7375 RepID=UPI001F06B048|nr:mitochondrial protein C2orf69 homolog isoform X1 [Lucilia cuprina]XP_046806693.1 mitochondrial protein C2orf69 homolog isoform X1 [Lucilia cuprina]XP_046806694.1 mitochondrial protein C2orf69 homolog isoform X1 [Lucilia cuprina]